MTPHQEYHQQTAPEIRCLNQLFVGLISVGNEGLPCATPEAYEDVLLRLGVLQAICPGIRCQIRALDTETCYDVGPAAPEPPEPPREGRFQLTFMGTCVWADELLNTATARLALCRAIWPQAASWQIHDTPRTDHSLGVSTPGRPDRSQPPTRS